MYSKEQTKLLQEKTREAINSKLLATAFKQKEADDLRAILRFHEYRYYVQNDPLISHK